MKTAIDKRINLINSINANLDILNRKIKRLKIHKDFASNIENGETYISNDISVIDEVLNSINLEINILNKNQGE